MLMKPRQLLKMNTKLFLDQVFIREGSYQNITKGTTSYDGADISRLAYVSDSEDLAELGFNITSGAGRVWQSPFRNWVYESGLVHSPDRYEHLKNPPVLASGVYVNNVFKPDRPNMPWGPAPGWDPTLFPTIDWLNGRVIMSSGLSTSDTVQADYSYGEVFVTFADRINKDVEEYIENLRHQTNPDQNLSFAYPSGRFQPVPAVFIEITDQIHDGAHEIGNRSLIEKDQITFYCFSHSPVILDNILDSIRLQDRRHMPIVDFNVVPIPLSDFLGERSPDYVRYDLLQGNIVVNPSGFSSLYAQGQFQNAHVTLLNEPFTAAGQVTIDIETRIEVPNGPWGTSAIGTRFFAQI